jgi:hypothetical protein
MGIFLTSSQVKGNFLSDCLRGEIIVETVSQAPTSLGVVRRGVKLTPNWKKLRCGDDGRVEKDKKVQNALHLIRDALSCAQGRSSR